MRRKPMESPDWMKEKGWKNQTKRNRTPTWQWVQHMVNKMYTGEEWVSKFKELPTVEQWKILREVNPQPKQVDINQGVRVILQIRGLDNDVKQVEGQRVETRALPIITGQEEEDPG